MTTTSGPALLDAATGKVLATQTIEGGIVTTAANARLALSAVGILNTYPNLTLSQSGEDVLFTVPTGKTADIFDVRLIQTTANTITLQGSPSVGGNSPTYDDWMPSTALPVGFTSVGDVVSLSELSLGGVRKKYAAGKTLIFNRTASTATSQIVTAVVVGVLY